MSPKRFAVPILAALALTAAPLAAQPAPPMGDGQHLSRNFDPNLLLYAAFPVLIAILLAVAASSNSSDDRPASA